MLTSGSIANQLHGNAVAVVAREMAHWTLVVLAQTRPFVAVVKAVVSTIALLTRCNAAKVVTFELTASTLGVGAVVRFVTSVATTNHSILITTHLKTTAPSR